ncbi:MAG: class II fructose-bisphosphate aldolase [Candidatus Hydrogenedentes bacterium]|nr:class II fructose-bisphosphate aldolase [Candidatus Hydrogenedentota bacterium]
MPIVDYKRYCQMLDKAKKEGYAYPAINITTMDTINGAIEGFAEAKSDGIIQVSTGGGQHASGNLKDMVLGAISLAEHAHRVAERYDINIALHTDHCQPGKVDGFLKPLIAETTRRRAAGLNNLFNSHMLDASELPLKQNMALSVDLLKLCAENEIILEVEAGVVGGEEDGVSHEGAPASKLYTTPEDMVAVYEALSQVKGARYMFAATFGNVHGVYKPGNVKLKPSILKDGQAAVVAKYGQKAHFDLVFHGGSGSSVEEIRETITYGVIKMNIDTDTQYAFTRPVVDFMLKNYDEVLKVEGEVGNKKKYDPRAWLKEARNGMAKRVVQGCNDLLSTGKTMGRG